MGVFGVPLVPLTPQAFAPYGAVIAASGAPDGEMNDATLARWDALATVETDRDGAAVLSIARCRRADSLPAQVPFVERHPLGSQAFVPLSAGALGIVVAPPGPGVSPADLRGFVTDGRQGVHYRRGVWHRPLIVLTLGQELLIVERGGPGDNCEEFHFKQPIEAHM